MAIDGSQDDILKLRRRWFRRLARMALTHAWMRRRVLPLIGNVGRLLRVVPGEAGWLGVGGHVGSGDVARVTVEIGAGALWRTRLLELSEGLLLG
jgi:hypothetical protein